MGIKKNKLLIIDDQKYVRFDLIEQLQSKGDNFEIITAESSGEGLEKFNEFKPDLVFLDLNMQDKSGLKTKLAGFEVLREIKFQSPSTFVIISTGYRDPVLIEEAEKRGANAFMVKGDYTTAALFDLLSEAGFKVETADGTIVSQKRSPKRTETPHNFTNNNPDNHILLNKLSEGNKKVERTNVIWKKIIRWFLDRTQGALDELLGSALIAIILYILGKSSGLLKGLPADWINQPETVVYIIIGIVLIILILGIYGFWQKRNK